MLDDLMVQCSETDIVTDKPSPPRDLTVSEVHADSVTLTWRASESDGGSPITAYIIERQDTKRGTWLNVSTINVSKYQSLFISVTAAIILRVVLS